MLIFFFCSGHSVSRDIVECIRLFVLLNEWQFEIYWFFSSSLNGFHAIMLIFFEVALHLDENWRAFEDNAACLFC